MSDITAAWTTMVDRLEPFMSPSWTKNAREHGQHPWIRLVLLVDAHDLLCKPGATEKIAMTMGDLADGREDAQRDGWRAIADIARDERITVISALVDESPPLLTPELIGFFERSVEPSAHFR
ncbi:MAG: hypothetical protein U0Y82_15435 [Thermoleophilia bacterium]